MTSSPDVLDTIAGLAEGLTPAKIAALRVKVNARLAVLETAQAQIEAIEEQTLGYSTDLATATGGITTATAQATAKAARVVTLQDQITALQKKISDGAPPSTPEDIAERDEVLALAAELSVTIP